MLVYNYVYAEINKTVFKVRSVTGDPIGPRDRRFRGGIERPGPSDRNPKVILTPSFTHSPNLQRFSRRDRTPVVRSRSNRRN